MTPGEDQDDPRQVPREQPGQQGPSPSLGQQPRDERQCEKRVWHWVVQIKRETAQQARDEKSSPREPLQEQQEILALLEQVLLLVEQLLHVGQEKLVQQEMLERVQ